MLLHERMPLFGLISTTTTFFVITSHLTDEESDFILFTDTGKETPGGESLGVKVTRKSDAKMNNQKGPLAVCDSGKFLARSIGAYNIVQPFHMELVVRREPACRSR